MKNLILITSEFPFLYGEPFLKNEIKYLSNAFNKIFIFSINSSSNDTITYKMPENVTCFSLADITSKAKYIKYILKGSISRHKDLSIHDYNFNHIIASMYIRGRAECISKQIYDIIQELDLNVNDVIIYSFWFSYQAVAAWLLSELLLKQGKKSFAVSRAHGYDLYGERVIGGFLPFQDVLLNKLTRCFPCSEHGMKYLINKYPWATNKIKIARLGTQDYGLNRYNGETTFATCCNMKSLKRMPLFAEAFCRVAKTNSSIKWICIGAGDDFERINLIVKNFCLTQQVIMKGNLTNDEVMNIYQTESISFFCNVSTTEGLPVSIMEAMSFGIPIIATDVGGSSELVNDETGYLIAQDITVEKLVLYLTSAINMPANKYIIMRKNARKKWEEIASAHKNYLEFIEDLYNMNSLVNNDC